MKDVTCEAFRGKVAFEKWRYVLIHFYRYAWNDSKSNVLFNFNINNFSKEKFIFAPENQVWWFSLTVNIIEGCKVFIPAPDLIETGMLWFILIDMHKMVNNQILFLCFSINFLKVKFIFTPESPSWEDPIIAHIAFYSIPIIAKGQIKIVEVCFIYFWKCTWDGFKSNLVLWFYK